MKKTLAFLLAFAMTVGVMIFGACDGAETISSSDGGASDSSLSDSSALGSSVDDDNSSSNEDSAQSSSDSASQSGNMSESAKAALEAAAEKSFKAENYTATETQSNTSSETVNEESVLQMGERASIIKYDGNKEERKETYKTKENPLDAWEISEDWYFYHFTSEDEEGRHGDYYYQDGNGVWYKGSVSSSVGGNANDSTIEIYENMYQQLTYEESTGVYTIIEYTLEGQDAMDILLKGPGFDSAETVNGTASIIFHRVEIELKDGYIYRAYVDMETHVDITAEYAGESVSCKNESTVKEEAVFTDYGTTVVTLPNVTE